MPGEPRKRVFKTLVTESGKGEYLVFVVPVCHEPDLKAAARAAGVKSVAMIKQKELEPLTGYVHGGCSPVGMKKRFRTFFDESARSFDTIFVSAGKRGVQMEVSPRRPCGLLPCVLRPARCGVSDKNLFDEKSSKV